MLIHHSFGFPNIFLKGGLKTPKTPLDPPLRAMGKSFNQYKNVLQTMSLKVSCFVGFL